MTYTNQQFLSCLTLKRINGESSRSLGCQEQDQIYLSTILDNLEIQTNSFEDKMSKKDRDKIVSRLILSIFDDHHHFRDVLKKPERERTEEEEETICKTINNKKDSRFNILRHIVSHLIDYKCRCFVRKYCFYKPKSQSYEEFLEDFKSTWLQDDFRLHEKVNLEKLEKKENKICYPASFYIIETYLQYFLFSNNQNVDIEKHCNFLMYKGKGKVDGVSRDFLKKYGILMKSDEYLLYHWDFNENYLLMHEFDLSQEYLEELKLVLGIYKQIYFQYLQGSNSSRRSSYPQLKNQHLQIILAQLTVNNFWNTSEQENTGLFILETKLNEYAKYFRILEIETFPHDSRSLYDDMRNRSIEQENEKGKEISCKGEIMEEALNEKFWDCINSNIQEIIEKQYNDLKCHQPSNALKNKQLEKILYLFFFQIKTNEEVAEKLNIAVGTVICRCNFMTNLRVACQNSLARELQTVIISNLEVFSTELEISADQITNLEKFEKIHEMINDYLANPNYNLFPIGKMNTKMNRQKNLYTIFMRHVHTLLKNILVE